MSIKENIFATVGRRKEAVARVRLTPGTGLITVNGKPLNGYFTEKALQVAVIKPLTLIGADKNFDVSVKVVGGGRNGQIGAITHGIARALEASDINNRMALKKAGMLTRDARIKERKKPGLRRARRSPQWAKR